MYSRVTFPRPPHSRFHPVSPFYPYTTFRHCITVSVWRYKSHSSFVPSPMMSSDKWAEHERRAPVVGLNFTFLRTLPLILHSANHVPNCAAIFLSIVTSHCECLCRCISPFTRQALLKLAEFRREKLRALRHFSLERREKKRFQLTSTKCSDLSQIPNIYLLCWTLWNHCSEELCQRKLCKPPHFMSTMSIIIA